MFTRFENNQHEILVNGEWRKMDEGREYDIVLTSGGHEYYCLRGGVVTRSAPPAKVSATEDPSTPAMLRLKRKQQLRGEPVTHVILEDGEDKDDWYVKMTSEADQGEIGALMGESGFTVLALDTVEAQKRFFQCCLYVGCVKGETDLTRYFYSVDEVEAWYDEPGMTETLDALMGVFFAVNPQLQPGAKKKIQVHLLKAG